MEKRGRLCIKQSKLSQTYFLSQKSFLCVSESRRIRDTVYWTKPVSIWRQTERSQKRGEKTGKTPHKRSNISDTSLFWSTTHRSSHLRLEGNNTHQPDVNAWCITLRVYGQLLQNITTGHQIRFQLTVFRLARAALHRSYRLSDSGESERNETQDTTTFMHLFSRWLTHSGGGNGDTESLLKVTRRSVLVFLMD